MMPARTHATRRALGHLAIAAAIAGAAGLGAQSKQPVPPSEYGKFESLVMPARALSPDGRWLAYGINRSNRQNELRVASVAGGEPTVIAFGTQPAFSADSRWVAYSIGYPESQEEKLRQQKKPIHRKLGLLDLSSGGMMTVDGIEAFAFSADGKFLAMKRYAPERRDQQAAGPPAPAPDEPAGATLLVRALADSRDTTFGNVTEYVWQDKDARLALAIGAEDKTGNGIQLFDAATGSLRVLDSAAETYSGLTWRKDADELAALRSKSDERRDGPTYVALAWQGLAGPSPRAHVFDPTAASAFPAGMRVISFRRPSWSDDGRTIFLGVAKWDEKPPQPAKADKDEPEGKDDKAADEPEDAAAVEVWHARDVDVMPRQKINARNDRQRNMLTAWHLEGNRVVQLGTDLVERVVPIRRQQLAYAAHGTPYAMQRSIGRPAADIYSIDIDTGARTKLKEAIEDQYLQASPGGRYLLYFQDDHYWTIDTRTRTVAQITKGVPAVFVDRESDATVRQKPPFGVAGWTPHDEAVVLYDKFDMWRVAADGSGAARLTNGTAEEIRHRYVRLDPDEEWIDLSGPVHVSLFGIRTKRSGYGRLTAGQPAVERLLFENRSIDRLSKSKDAGVYAYVAQAFDAPPQVLVGSASLTDARPVVITNPFAADYAWGRGELVDYKSDRGERLQGALFYPAGYQAGKKYPMVVYMYERLSDGLHRWSSPSDREPYNAAVFTSLGYFFFQPDIVFRPREPGLSVVECVGPAVRKVIAMGLADPARVGIVGHSWGGFDTVYLATHTNLFAAGVAGAPITNLVSNYGNHHWSAGIAETDHIETGQQRMEVPLWEDLPAYIRNSAVFGVHTMTTPLLVAFGDNDGTVHWHQGVELYNIARRAKKDVVMLVYGNEDHGLRRKPNQQDYHRRIVQWFGHYLKNEPAPAWITSGVSFLDREQELKRNRKGSSQ